MENNRNQINKYIKRNNSFELGQDGGMDEDDIL